LVDWIALIVSIIAAFGAAAIGGLSTSKSIPTWYRGLRKPWFNPPDWAFGPVWIILYLLMAVAAWLVWSENAAAPVVAPLTFYGIQLGLNSLWSYIFFARKDLPKAFVEIIALWIMILITTALFWNVSQLAGILMLPYISWVSVASALNYRIWKLNP
jgi:tryptophan-rich sensory protein